MKAINIRRFATILFLSSAVFLTMVSCSQNAKHSEKSDLQELKLAISKVEKLPDSLELKSEDELLNSNAVIFDPSFSLIFINGERCRDNLPDDPFRNGEIQEIPIEVLRAFLKERNYILDDVKILKDDESLKKYRKGGYVASGAEKRIEIVYEIKAHLINPKGEIFRFVKKMPRFPGGYDAQTLFIAENVRHPKEMLRQGIYGMVLVDCVIGKDGAVEEPKVIDYHLKDKAGNPCNNPTIKKLCNKEALRVVKKMPRWEPGRQEDGEAVRVREHITIYFLEKMPPQTEREK